MSQEKTEQPTPRKLQKARERGEVFKSRELTQTAVLFAIVGVLASTGASVQVKFADLYRVLIAQIAAPTIDIRDALKVGAEAGAKILAPIMIAAFVISLAVTYLQVGPVFSMEENRARLQKRVNPAEGMKNVFSKRRLVDAGNQF
ncbi:MAG: EscU/YscU/HrcU family type III secretion system export apparatus switch protein [Polyangiales bacterium]